MILWILVGKSCLIKKSFFCFILNVSWGFSAEQLAKWIHDRADVQVN